MASLPATREPAPSKMRTALRPKTWPDCSGGVPDGAGDFRGSCSAPPANSGATRRLSPWTAAPVAISRCGTIPTESRPAAAPPNANPTPHNRRGVFPPTPDQLVEYLNSSKNRSSTAILTQPWRRCSRQIQGAAAEHKSSRLTATATASPRVAGKRSRRSSCYSRC